MARVTVCLEPDCGAKVKARGLCAKHYSPSETYPAEFLTPSEMRDLFRAAGTGAKYTSTRNVALLWLLYRSGVRIAEALALLPHDVDMRSGTVFVRRGKGSKARRVGIDESAFPAINAWKVIRRCDPSDPLFCSSRGKPLQTSYARSLMRRLGKEAGIEKRVHPHILRHTLAVEMVREGISVEYIRQQLGHSNLGTTTKYLASLSPEETINVVRQRKLAWEKEEEDGTEV